MRAYRRDLVERLGIDVERLRTWDEFVEVGKRVTIPGKRFMMELPPAGISVLEVMLFQRGGGYFDAQGNCTLDNEIAVDW